ncbi:MAG: cbb3-type cytochrome oxidase assembly protein CcoS [Cyclobacteriaceae bacterium]|nr:cbb3-type cytochrome oxidase assembly protein CcoS [Cyclobacteriaceae bacterium]MCX7637142.1 cbb3-type cytochrome oxidase assembly protein CcoS [Cyclobacteriaceae bacterium]MDW8330044.1 cbb3-type cytochrome oxidase assembly protein CcoS [Cyclobacteriaceae bacterium]
MKIIILLIGISVSVAVVFLLIFIWSMKSGQFDDTYTPSVRMLFDEADTKSDSKGSKGKPVKKDNQPA